MNWTIILGAALLFAVSMATHAANTPCSGKKGGISHCESGRFICNDGTVSQSKKTCMSPERNSQPKRRKS
ncbi:MAG: hypothetical protein Q8O79_00930 [Pseudomonadota bacterium]|nr:hypothetical protein [Pseudomonadota bacterium]